jgi:hypothetical protein
MTMIETALLMVGCSIFAVLGRIHAVFTFTTNKFDARDARLNEAMKRTSPVLTRETSMWNAWVGFNASHSLGAILFGLVFIILAFENYPYLKSSVALNTLLVAVPLIYVALAMAGTLLIGLSLALRLAA